MTNQSRGFGFVKFKDPNCVGTVLASRPHNLDGRTVSWLKSQFCFGWLQFPRLSIEIIVIIRMVPNTQLPIWCNLFFHSCLSCYCLETNVCIGETRDMGIVQKSGTEVKKKTAMNLADARCVGPLLAFFLISEYSPKNIFWFEDRPWTSVYCALRWLWALIYCDWQIRLHELIST